MNAYLIAAASSGSGKTTLTIGLLRALARRGLGVQPCKCGPVETSLFCTGRIIASYVHWSPEAIVELFTQEKWKL